MTAGQLLAMLKQLPQEHLSLPVAYATNENNTQGWVSADSIKIAPADYGQQVLITSDQIS